jgi:predicted metal-binding protein
MTAMEDLIKEVLNEETCFAKILDLAATPLPCSEMVIRFCEDNACGKYGANWTCPPAVGSYKDCTEAIGRYSKALIFRSEYKLNEWYDAERIEETLRAHQANVRRVRALIPKDMGDHMMLSGGGCVYCKECAYVNREPCRHPDIAIPPLEAYGIDWFRFAKKHGIKYGSPEGEMYYFGMVLFN